MFSNLKRAVSLVLLASAAGTTLAAPAPVSNINESNSTPVSTPASPENEVQRLERLLQNRNRIQIQMQQQMDDMTAEMSDLRGLVERNSYEIKKLLDRQRELFLELDRVRSQAQTASQFPEEAAQEKAELKSAGTFSSNQKEREDYEAAVDLILTKKDYSGALEALNQFQATYPDSVYSPNANYWLGQLYFAKKQDVEAAKHFASVVSFTDSGKRADALVKLGDIAKRNKKPDVANKYYQQAIDEYPDSASAKTAKSRIEK
ncbi:tol-pal system protein YbgF [Vibrio hannami]|uniref:tol-pal system protein YbgF n=1 Tax=Vibrio hannami TaxID=2717094 RepID=UPI00240EFB2F|nr:tol-pal system protein YbgF [Vibrio hannami]MDG3087723.1 tol-pal system protein YbgF [Vibrio hannami]